MSKWLSPQKMLRRFGDVAEAERQLYLAVVRGDVRARLNGKILGPEWLTETSSFALPRDIELAAEDASGLAGVVCTGEVSAAASRGAAAEQKAIKALHRPQK
jgi:hypothetical protein